MGDYHSRSREVLINGELGLYPVTRVKAQHHAHFAFSELHAYRNQLRKVGMAQDSKPLILIIFLTQPI